MVELSIDTSTRYASVGLSMDGEPAVELSWRSYRNHSMELVPAIREVMSRRRVEMADLDAVFVARGPGGFSALRVGMSTAKTLADALDVPLVSVPTLDIEARPYLGLGCRVGAVMPAGRGRVYFAEYGLVDESEAPEYEVCRYDDVAGRLTGAMVICGEAASELASSFGGCLGEEVRVAAAPPPTRRAGVLADMAHRRLTAGRTDDPATLQPIYLRASQIEVADKARRSKSPLPSVGPLHNPL